MSTGAAISTRLALGHPLCEATPVLACRTASHAAAGRARIPSIRIRPVVQALILVAIAGIVVGLALAAAQQVREAAGLMQCGNNLRQITIAAHNANDTYGFVPSNPDAVESFSGTTQYLLLPFME